MIDTLSRIEYELERLLNQARNGIYALQEVSRKTEPSDSEETEMETEADD